MRGNPVIHSFFMEQDRISNGSGCRVRRSRAGPRKRTWRSTWGTITTSSQFYDLRGFCPYPFANGEMAKQEHSNGQGTVPCDVSSRRTNRLASETAILEIMPFLPSTNGAERGFRTGDHWHGSAFCQSSPMDNRAPRPEPRTKRRNWSGCFAMPIRGRQTARREITPGRVAAESPCALFASSREILPTCSNRRRMLLDSANTNSGLAKEPSATADSAHFPSRPESTSISDKHGRVSDYRHVRSASRALKILEGGT